jgi:hypothetical protein
VRKNVVTRVGESGVNYNAVKYDRQNTIKYNNKNCTNFSGPAVRLPHGCPHSSAKEKEGPYIHST